MLSLLFLPLEMNICNKPSNKTAPEKNVWTAPAQASGPSPELQGQRSRRNGWSWPPHPLQIVAWLLYLFFAVIGFGVLVPLLPHHWVPAGYAVSLGKYGAGTWESSDSGWRDMGKAQSWVPEPQTVQMGPVSASGSSCLPAGLQPTSDPSA